MGAMKDAEIADANQNPNPGFAAYVLLSEPIEFQNSEIEAALLEDYPSLDLHPDPSLSIPQHCNTDEFFTSFICTGSRGADGVASIGLIRLRGYGVWDPNAIQPRQMIGCPDLKDRLARNASYICVSVGARSNETTDVFRAARLCSAVAAIFAKLPAALAVYWQTADHFLSPDRVVAMADQAICDDWPVNEWIGATLTQSKDAHTGRRMAAGATNGLLPFKGFEVSMPSAPIELPDLYGFMMGTCRASLSLGAVYRDGDTMGADDNPDFKYRLRYAPTGTQGSKSKLLIVVHPEAAFDAEEVLGPSDSVPPPPGMDNSLTYDDRGSFFKRLLRGGRIH